MVDLILLVPCLLILAACQWYLMRRESPRRADHESRIVVNGRECRSIEEARAEADWLQFCGIAPVVEWPGLEESEPIEAAQAAGVKVSDGTES